MVTYTTPGMKSNSADKVIALLQDRLESPGGTPGALAARRFARAHLEQPDGSLRTAGAASERSAARRVSSS